MTLEEFLIYCLKLDAYLEDQAIPEVDRPAPEE